MIRIEAVVIVLDTYKCSINYINYININIYFFLPKCHLPNWSLRKLGGKCSEGESLDIG